MVSEFCCQFQQNFKNSFPGNFIVYEKAIL